MFEELHFLLQIAELQGLPGLSRDSVRDRFNEREEDNYGQPKYHPYHGDYDADSGNCSWVHESHALADYNLFLAYPDPS
jgi:hypothetical protein